MTARPLLCVCLVAAITGGCNQTRAPAAAPAVQAAAPGVTPSTFQLPEGAGCSGEVARYRAVMENDLATGHVSKGVHQQVTREIDQAGMACAAGRDAEAVRIIQASKARRGYR